MLGETDYLRLAEMVKTSGPDAAIDALDEQLRREGDYQGLFYVLLLRERLRLGVSPFPTAPATELPEATHEAYENAIRTAGRVVGQLYLEKRELAKAWGFYRMLGEPLPVKEALEKFEPGDDDDVYALVDIAWQQGVHPQKGFDLILDRHGICSAITMLGGVDLSGKAELRDYCVRRLIRALHSQLAERLKNELLARHVEFATDATVPDLLRGQESLFADDGYIIDISHLQSVVQFALQLSRPCDEIALARELCDYGQRLAPNLQSSACAPFENNYADYDIYLGLLTGDSLEEGLAHFYKKLPAAKAEGETFPAEVLINLLVKFDRLPAAIKVAKEHLPNEPGGEYSCPSLFELARRSGDFVTASEAAKVNADPVNFLAGVIAGQKTAGINPAAH